METIEIRTLVDITNSGVTRNKPGSENEYNQYKNWTTLLQCIGLRAIIDYDTPPEVLTVDLKQENFGTKFKGKQNVWVFRFNTDRSGCYLKEDSDLGLLVDDLHNVPIIKNLNESINISKSVFDLLDNGYRNTVITKVELDTENLNV